jgi:hypothetical protein
MDSQDESAEDYESVSDYEQHTTSSSESSHPAISSAGASASNRRPLTSSVPTTLPSSFPDPLSSISASQAASGLRNSSPSSGTTSPDANATQPTTTTTTTTATTNAPQLATGGAHAASDSLSLTIEHKPRGLKGAWIPVKQQDKLRVTKGKGKRVKLCFSVAVDSQEDVVIELRDLENGSQTCNEDFSVIAFNSTSTRTEMEVKIFKASKRLKFFFQAKSHSKGQVFHGESVEISTHNSGTIPPKDVQMHKVTVPTSSNEPTRKRQKIKSTTDVVVPRMTTIDGNLDVFGNIKAHAFYQFSDLRLKTNVEDIVGAIDVVTKLQGKRYEWKQEDDNSGIHSPNANNGSNRVIGLIAQEVQKILPEIVSEDPESGYLSVSYTELLPILIEAFKEFIDDYGRDKTELNERVKDLDSKIDDIRRRMLQLHQQNDTSSRKLTLSSRDFLLQVIEQHNQQVERERQQSIASSSTPSTPAISPSSSKRNLFSSTSSSSSLLLLQQEQQQQQRRLSSPRVSQALLLDQQQQQQQQLSAPKTPRRSGEWLSISQSQFSDEAELLPPIVEDADALNGRPKNQMEMEIDRKSKMVTTPFAMLCNSMHIALTVVFALAMALVITGCILIVVNLPEKFASLVHQTPDLSELERGKVIRFWVGSACMFVGLICVFISTGRFWYYARTNKSPAIAGGSLP